MMTAQELDAVRDLLKYSSFGPLRTHERIKVIAALLAEVDAVRLENEGLKLLIKAHEGGATESEFRRMLDIRLGDCEGL